jgi:hypothetical protein
MRAPNQQWDLEGSRHCYGIGTRSTRRKVSTVDNYCRFRTPDAGSADTTSFVDSS